MVIRTDELAGLECEVVQVAGANGDQIKAYVAKPEGEGPFPGMVLIHHMPGWDEWYWEATRRFAQHGYAAICPNLYERNGDGAPDEVAGRAREAGGIPDAQVVGDLAGAMGWLREQGYSSGKVGIFGTCSGGRHGYVAAAKLGDKVDALIHCWGGRTVQAPDQLTPNQPENPISLTSSITAPILGIFGNDDQNPPPDQVNQLEEELKNQGKQYEFHRYDGAGHGFFYYDRAAYRQEQAVDGWGKIWDFLGRTLK